MKPRGPRRELMWVIAFLLAACATTTSSLPPIKPIQDVKELAGEWSGWVMIANQNTQVKLVIKDDGSFIANRIYGVATPLTGEIYRSGDQILYKTSRPSNGMITVYENAGQRVLRFTPTSGTSADFTPIK
jgi:hypothetical protein